MTASPRPSLLGTRLPSFYCPLERDLVHPEAKQVEARAVEWLDAFGLYPDAAERAWGLATHSADFSCRIIPDGKVEALLLFTEWNYWANAVDDWQDSGSDEVGTGAVVEHGARLLRTMEDPGVSLLPEGPMTRALVDLVSRTHAMLTPYELRRFVEGTRDWLLGAAWRAAQAETGTMPGLNDFVAMGPLANGTRFSLTWSDVARADRLPHGRALLPGSDGADGCGGIRRQRGQRPVLLRQGRPPGAARGESRQCPRPPGELLPRRGGAARGGLA